MTVGTTRHDGSVQMTPVWYEYRDGQIWLNGGPKRDWVKHMKRDPIQGRLVDTSTEGADDHIEHLSQRYLGGPYRNPKVDRLIVRIAPERVTGYESGQPWDVTG